MQNCYVGDSGDFGKYGLLRALAGMGKSSTFGTRLRLGVVWYHYPDEPDNPDGNRTAYLKATGSKRDRFRDCDPPLYDALKRLVDENRRNVYAVQQCGILPMDTLYYGVSLSYRRSEDRAERQAKREHWLAGALEAVSEADVVFVDPDNGVASEKVVPWRKTGPKYVFMDDLRQLYQRRKSLIIYHHLGRNGTAEQQMARRACELQQGLGLSTRPPALRWRRGTARVYFIVGQPPHQPIIEKTLEAFREAAGPWRDHFVAVG